MKDIEKINYIADHYGFISQREMLIEECAELIQAVQKLKRAEATDDTESLKKATDSYLEELADVAIMVEQMHRLMSLEQVGKFNDNLTIKLDRQIDRIEKAKQQEKEDYHKWREGVTA